MPEPSPRRWPLGLASVVAVLIAGYATYCAVMSAWIGFESIRDGGHLWPGLALVLLAVLAVWYVGALFASLWFRREGRCIRSGLFFGFVILWWLLGVLGHGVFTRLTEAGAPTAKPYFEAFGLGPVLVAAWILTGLLLIRPALVRRPAAESA